MSYRSCCEDSLIKDQEIAQLQQKLEHAVHMNKILLKRLEETVKEAKWQRGRRRGYIPPTLPNELWLVIFNYATECKGPLYRGNQEDIEWNESFLARHSIPLVCRQWEAAGRQFLYTRPIFYRTRQMDRIMRTSEERPEYLGWCRDVELLQSHGEFGVDNEDDFYGSALSLLQRLPRLRSLVINPLYDTKCSGIKTMVQAVQPKLQSLQLSSTLRGVWDSIFQEAQADTEGAQLNNYNWNLRMLSTVDQHWWNPRSYKDSLFQEVTRLRLPSLRTLCMDWPDRQNGSIFSFLRQHPFLTEVYLGGGSKEFSTFMPDFDKFLSVLPRLRSLSIGMPARMETTTTEGALTHKSLETILVRNISWFGRADISGLQPILKKLELGELPACKAIEMQGDFIDGCVDADVFIRPKDLYDWRDAIRICEERHVSLVNKVGQKLFLWTDRHGIHTSNGDKLKTNFVAGDERSASTSDSDEESWTEDEGEMTDTMGSVESDKNQALEDCSDTPYVYKRRADIRPVEDDSDSEFLPATK